MENTDKNINKATETLVKELESMSNEGLRDFFKFFYKMNHIYENMITKDNFEKFLSAFDENPFKINEDKKFRKQLIEAVIKYSHDHMSLITAAVLIKKKFTIDELAENYNANIDLFGTGWY